MDIKITPAKLNGTIQAVSNKTYSHRLFIASSLSENPTKIYMKNGSLDLSVTFDVLKNFGFRANKNGNEYLVTPKNSIEEKISVDVHDSAPSLRFLLPILCALSEQVTVVGEGKLLARSHADLLYALKGVGFTSEKLPFTIKGRLNGGDYYVNEKLSMQFVSGLMLALPLLDKDSRIIFNGNVNTTNAQITALIMQDFGVEVVKEEKGYFIKGSQKYVAPQSLNVEGDYALSCVWKLCNKLGSNIKIENLNPNTLQSEKARFDTIDKLFLEKTVNDIETDLLPCLIVGACFKKGETLLNIEKGVSNKELAKIYAFVNAINKLGGKVTVNGNAVLVRGEGELKGGQMVDSYADYRFAMALTVAGCFAKEPIKILDAQVVLKHYATFFNDVNLLGGKTQVE